MSDTLPFLAFRIPAEGMPLTALTRSGERRIDLLLGPTDPRRPYLHPFRFIGRGFDRDDVARFDEPGPPFHQFASISHDAATGRWEAEGLIDSRGVAHAGLRALPALLSAFDRPWFHLEDGVAEARFLPLLGEDLMRLQRDLQKTLEDAGTPLDVGVSYMDADVYGRWKRRLVQVDHPSRG